MIASHPNRVEKGARMRRLLVAVLAMMTLPSHESAYAVDCSAALRDAVRLIVVTASGQDQADAIVETFMRSVPTEAWRVTGGLRSAVVGHKGVAWGAGFRHLAKAGEQLKEEGDMRSPMGIYGMGPAFGFSQASYPGYIMLQTDRHICVEDPGSAFYGRIVARSDVAADVKFDQMHAEDLYRKGLVVDYPADGLNKAGSCIFIHVWRQPGKGTAGCVALDEADVGDLQSWVSAAPTAIAILTVDAKARFKGCLP